MEYTTFTNSCTYVGKINTNIEDFHKRLQNLYPCVEDVTRLPHTWSPETKAAPLGLTNDNLGCYFRANRRVEEDDKCAASVKTDHYIPPSCLLYYFEIKFISKGKEGIMGIGLTSAHVPLTKLPGWTKESYGYHADDGNTFCGDSTRGHSFGPTFTSNDVIGCGYNLVEGNCFFTKNGLNLGKAFDDIPANLLLYPTIGLKTPGEEIQANFGQEEFVYDIEQDLRLLRKNMTLTISNYPITNFSTWQDSLHKLVQSWLLENSYPNTAEAFTKATKLECKENLQRIQQRNQIQQLVLNGKISEAIRLTDKLCPDLLRNNPNLLFALKCRQFIELISGADNDYQPIFTYANNNINNSNSNNDTSDSFATNGLFKISTSVSGDCDQVDHLTSDNGCNGMIASDNNRKSDNHQQPALQPTLTSSSSSSQELMDIDQPHPNNTDDHQQISNHRNASSTTSLSKNNHSSATPSTSSTSPTTTQPQPPPVSSAIATTTIIQEPNQLTKILESNGSKQDNLPNNEKVTLHNDENDPELDDNEQKFARLIHFGRELSEYSQQLDRFYGRNEFNERMLHDAISLIAFTDPKKSHIGKLLDPREREPISQLLNSTIMKAEMGDSYRPPLEEVVNHLRRLIRLNNSQGRWLVDRLIEQS